MPACSHGHRRRGSRRPVRRAGYRLAVRALSWSGSAASAEAEVARLDAALRVEQATAQERVTLMARTDAALRDTFGALSAEALQRNNEAFVTLAEARLGMARAAADGDLVQRQQAIDSVVGPLRESLDAMQQQLRSVERERAGSYSALLEQVGAMRQTSEQLRTETVQLVTALRAPQIRGRWGELQLERAVEAAGMTEHIDYVTQATASGEDGSCAPTWSCASSAARTSSSTRRSHSTRTSRRWRHETMPPGPAA